MVAGLPLQNTQGITRHFARVGTQDIHYLRAGSGPCVVLLHGSPESSLAMVGFINILKDRFTVIAPDTPGNGNSDPLDIEIPTIPDYAHAFADFLDAIGIRQTALYGFHTGAEIAMQYAVDHPDRVSQVIANGFPLFTDGERQNILDNYLPEFHPEWDGSHLAWAWARIQEQVIFFPWHERTNEARMQRTFYPPEFTQLTILQLLKSGDEYRKPYRAAFAFDGEPLLSKISVPATITGLSLDPLCDHLERIEGAPDNVSVLPLTCTFPEAYEMYGKIFEQHPAVEPPAASDDDISQRFALVDGGQVYYKEHAGSGRPLLLLHGPAESSEQFHDLFSAQNITRPVYAIDLPSNGESDNTYQDGVPTNEEATQKISAFLDVMGWAEVDILGIYNGAYIATEVAHLRPDIVKQITLLGVADYSEVERKDLLDNYAPDLSAKWDGTHLITAWRMLRLKGLFWPWHHMSEDAIINHNIEVEDLQRQFLDLMKCLPTYQASYKAEFSYDFVARATDLKVPMRIGQWKADPLSPQSKIAAEKIGVPLIDLPDDMADWGPSLAE